MKFFMVFLLLLNFMVVASAHAAETHHSKYAGQQFRQIKSLSDDDIAELKRGGGWGLAKAAELNGMPGPAHILELKQQLKLTQEQAGKIEALYAEMNQQAKLLGESLIKLETELNDEFVNKTINQDQLEKLVNDIEGVRAKLRITHLSTHLKTPGILTKDQIALYNELRGYSKDPCAHVPEGHDPQMWKKHNNCN